MTKPHVLLVPLPSQGHVIPMMELGEQLVRHGIKVTIINTEVNHKILSIKFREKEGYEDVVQLVSIPDGLGPSDDRNDDIHKLIKSMQNVMPGELKELIESINKENDCNVTCIIADCTMGWAIRVGKNLGIPGAAFWPASATTFATTISFQKLIDDGIINSKGDLFLFF